MSPIQDAPAGEVVLKMDHCVHSSSDPQYEGYFRELLHRASTLVTLDLSGLGRINPQTIRLILLLRERLWRGGKVLRIRGLREDDQALFRRLKIDRYIRCLP